MRASNLLYSPGEGTSSTAHSYATACSFLTPLLTTSTWYSTIITREVSIHPLLNRRHALSLVRAVSLYQFFLRRVDVYCPIRCTPQRVCRAVVVRTTTGNAHLSPKIATTSTSPSLTPTITHPISQYTSTNRPSIPFSPFHFGLYLFPTFILLTICCPTFSADPTPYSYNKPAFPTPPSSHQKLCTFTSPTLTMSLLYYPAQYSIILLQSRWLPTSTSL